MAEFITAYEKKSGARRRIPAFWFDVPLLAANFRKNPPKGGAKPSGDSQATRETPATGEKE